MCYNLVIIFGFTKMKQNITKPMWTSLAPAGGGRLLTELRLLANDLRNFTSFLFTTLNLYLVKKTLANI